MKSRTLLVLTGVVAAILVIALTFVGPPALGLWMLGLLVFAAVALFGIRSAAWLQEFMSSDQDAAEWEIVPAEIYTVIGISIPLILVTLFILLSDSYSEINQIWVAGLSGLALGLLVPPFHPRRPRAVNALLLAAGAVVVCGGILLLFFRQYSDAGKCAAGALGFIVGFFIFGGFFTDPRARK